MKRKLLSLVCCLAICLSLFVPTMLYGVAAEDSQITGVKAYPLGPVWDAGSYAVDGDATTGWHSQYAFAWGVLFIDLGKAYDLTKIDLVLPDALTSTGVTIDMLNALPTSDLNPDTGNVEEGYDPNDGKSNGYYLGEMPTKGTVYSGTLTTAQNTLTVENANGVQYLRVKFADWTATNKNPSINFIICDNTVTIIKC